ncbi:MAG: hypothetical protein Q7R49_05555 [Candidatus Daviesbacteria bacterium]|nr:hypothetical protein [Candidatus Daviesbacteria bacterium]
MITQQLQSHPQAKGKKTGPKIVLAIENLSDEERLNALTDLIIERILEERHKKAQTP